MQRRITAPAVITAAFLALTGCGTGSGTTTAPAATAEAAQATAAAPTPTPTPAKTFSNTDLSGLLATLKDAQGKPLTVVPSAQIDQGILKAKEMFKTAVFTPAECKALADTSSQVPDGSTYAGATSISTAAQTATVVTVISLKDAQAMTDQLNASKAAASATQCKSFTVEVGGQKITTETTVVNAETNGEKSFAALSKQNLSTGQTQTALTVTGVKGNLAATAVKTGPAVTEQTSAELIQLINTILAHG